jgi:hypothetical protein
MNSRSAIQRDALRTSITFFTVTSSPVPQVFRTYITRGHSVNPKALRLVALRQRHWPPGNDDATVSVSGALSPESESLEKTLLRRK